LKPASRWLIHQAIRLLLAAHALALRAARFLGPGPRPVTDGLEILLTGTFYSGNWIASHVRPLAGASRCASVRVVSTFPVPPLDKVVAIYPPRWLARALGGVPARLATFLWTALRTRPHVVGGFHLLVNALVAEVVAPLVGARSLYFCVGGTEEVADGGIRGENRLFSKMQTPDAVVERRLERAVSAFDLVITMGQGAARHFRQRGARGVHVVPGGIDARRFRPAEAPPARDLILVGRLAPIKRIDIFLRAVARVAQARPSVTAAVVGDGALRPALEALAREIGVGERVAFLGHRRDVEQALRESRLFVLTSDSEGLALSAMEAMMCGLPAIVPEVGDLPDLVQDGVNGYLVRERAPEAFAARILELLCDPGRLARFAAAARRSAARYETEATARLWDAVLAQDATGSAVARR
jgi:glycosyltransferase involved in cell wall biosynthesis